MNDAEAVVASLTEAWRQRDVEAIVEHFAPEATYHNIPLEPAVGHDAIRAVVTEFVGMADEIRFETLNQLSDGGLVMNERIDTFVLPDGRELPLRVMGVFEVRDDGLIEAWRDYFQMPDSGSV